MLRWDTGSGCLGIILLSILGLYGFVYIVLCIQQGCP